MIRKIIDNDGDDDPPALEVDRRAPTIADIVQKSYASDSVVRQTYCLPCFQTERLQPRRSSEDK